MPKFSTTNFLKTHCDTGDMPSENGMLTLNKIKSGQMVLLITSKDSLWSILYMVK